jgi:hypothetical protein
MIKKFIFWFYVAIGPLIVIFLTFGESLWPLRIPADYLFIIVVGFLSVMISVLLMTSRKLNLSKKKFLYYSTPFWLYLGLISFTYYFMDGRMDKLQLLSLIILFALVYTVVSQLTVLIYKYWVNPQSKKSSSNPIDVPRRFRMGHFIQKIVKIMTLSTMMILLPLIWWVLIIFYNSELRINYEAYIYEQDPTTENLTDLAVDLLNYRGYEARIKYLPIIMENDEVLQQLYEKNDESNRAGLYLLMGETNLSYIIYPEDAKALVMTQYINAFLMLGREEEYLNLMMTRSEQFVRGDFYYMFEGNVIMYNREYIPVLPNMLRLLEKVYDAVDVKDKTLLVPRMYNIRIRQTIYYLLGDEENDAALEVLFKQLMEEIKTYKESQENK